jgi:AraC-like DNA-binding protein
VSYRERAIAPGVVLWESRSEPGASGATILPDGCVDLIWDGTRLLVAGPDTRARHHVGGGHHVGVRFSHGVGPGALGVAADAVRDTGVALDAVWSDRAARDLTDRVADDPVRGLADWAVLAGRAGRAGADRFGACVFAAARSGVRVDAIADALGVGPRTLHRRCLPVFGYGPQHLGRVLRLQRALALARDGRGRPGRVGRAGWAGVAADAGYADQPHLAREVRALAGTTPTGLLALRGVAP